MEQQPCSSRFARLLIVSVLALAARAQDDPKDLLLRCSHKVMDTLQRLPKYVCTQTVERAQYEPDAKPRSSSCEIPSSERHLIFWDRLRLDVATGISNEIFGGSNEMYSWAGQNRFHDHGLTELVPRGAIATGSFYGYLASILGGNDSASFSYRGDTTVNGKLLAEFAYRVPPEKSTYTFWYGKAADEHVTTGYDGSFLIDPATADLVRLIIRTSALPAKTRACEVVRTLDYRRVDLSGTYFLLPAEVYSSLIRIDGTQAENDVHYSSCREFHGESIVNYDEAENVKYARSAPAIINPELPGRLEFKVVLTEPIDTAVAASGDTVKGRLKSAIRNSSGHVFVPEGTAVTARILKLQYSFAPPGRKTVRDGRPRGVLTLAIKLETLDLGGILQTFTARVDTGFRRSLKIGGLSKPVELGRVDSTQDPETAVFDFPDVSRNYVVQAGLESSWVTVSSAPARQPR
jgi:hypothetical protein